MESAAGAGAGAGSDCEGEEQEDSSSSHSNDLQQARKALEQLTLDNEQSNNNDDELTAFRQQWQRELVATPSPQREKPIAAAPEPKPEEPLTDEDRAKQLFLRGVEMERGGKLYEAIQHYKRAIQILPDVETRLYESTEPRGDSPTVVEEEIESVAPVDEPDENEVQDEDAVEGEDLYTRLQRVVAKRGYLIQPAVPTKGAHLSWLPYEVLQLVLRWAVSAQLDAAALERAAGACRGLYVAARDPDLWRSLCVRTWGIECGTPRAGGFASWRQMYVERPRLQLHGCYISKTTYLRPGENSFQDHSYRPWYLIDYYRYLRFFPEGHVVMWTSAEEPSACVAQLQRSPRASLGILAGHYRLVGDKHVVIVIKKTNSEKKSSQGTNTRFRARRKEAYEQHEQVFHIELELRAARSRRYGQLAWRRYAVAARLDQWAAFDLPPAKFPPFAFSPVRAYTARALAPLATHAA